MFVLKIDGKQQTKTPNVHFTTSCNFERKKIIKTKNYVSRAYLWSKKLQIIIETSSSLLETGKKRVKLMDELVRNKKRRKECTLMIV